MAKYYYEKYNLKKIIKSEVVAKHTTTENNRSGMNTCWGYSGYRITGHTYELTGERMNFSQNVKEQDEYNSKYGNFIPSFKYEVYRVGNDPRDLEYLTCRDGESELGSKGLYLYDFNYNKGNFREFTYTVYAYAIKDVDVKGEFIEKIIASEGDYPANGKQGNYWYIQGKKLTTELKTSKEQKQIETVIKIGGGIKHVTPKIKLNGKLYDL